MFIVPMSALPPLEAVGSGAQTNTANVLQGIPFADTLQDAMADLKESQAVAAQDTYDLAMGNAPDLH